MKRLKYLVTHQWLARHLSIFQIEKRKKIGIVSIGREKSKKSICGIQYSAAQEDSKISMITHRIILQF